MAPKAKKAAANLAVEEPLAKKPKAEENVESKKEETKAEEIKDEKNTFEEPDAPKDNRTVLKDSVAFATSESTLNVVPTMGGRLLTAITDSGMSYLLAGARTNVGVKAGRYMFEVKVIQNLSTAFDKNKPLLKIGFSKAGSSLFLGEDGDSVAFDGDGFFVSEKKRVPQTTKWRFAKGATVAVVLNLDPKSPNANTVNLYIAGEKVGEPKRLPAGLEGQALFPHVTYRNVTIQVNFGPAPLKALPFKCRMVQGAAQSDVTVTSSKDPKDGKYEVAMPVAIPDEATFDWVDSFLEKNPNFVELSDRKIVEWCKSSGLLSKAGLKGSNDRPAANFGVQGLDDLSVRKVISAIAPCVPRNYLVMEVKANLIAADRKDVLRKFNYPCYKKVAHVVVGKPDAEFQELVRSKILKTKQAKADITWKAQRAAAKKQQQAKAKVVLARKRIEVKKKEEEIDEPMADENNEGEENDEDKDAEPPAVELTEEESQTCFASKAAPDLSPQVMSANFAKFTMPDEEEGFDDIRYVWNKGEKAEAYFKDWLLSKKLTTRIDDIKPGQFFKDKTADFLKLYQGWYDKVKAAKPAKKAEEEPDDDLDIFAVTDINDIGNNVPLFQNFTYEDWELVKLRYELSALLIAFKKDCEDPDRVGIPLDHVSFYYKIYFGKAMNLKAFGCSSERELFALVKDTVTTKDSLLISLLSDDIESLDIFVKLTEEHRRERQRRIDAGDETARLKFLPNKGELLALKKPEPKAMPKGENKPAPKQVPAPKLTLKYTKV